MLMRDYPWLYEQRPRSVLRPTDEEVGRISSLSLLAFGLHPQCAIQPVEVHTHFPSIGPAHRIAADFREPDAGPMLLWCNHDPDPRLYPRLDRRGRLPIASTFRRQLIGSQRIAFNFFSRITRLPPHTGDQPEPVLPMQKRPKNGSSARNLKSAS